MKKLPRFEKDLGGFFVGRDSALTYLNNKEALDFIPD